MKTKPRHQDQFQLIPEAEMPFNLAGEDISEMTNEEWETYCHAFAEENRRKIKEEHANRNSTAPFN